MTEQLIARAEILLQQQQTGRSRQVTERCIEQRSEQYKSARHVGGNQTAPGTNK